MPAHFENLHRVRAALDDGLHEREHFAVLEAHEPRGTDQIALLEPQSVDRLVVVGITEIGPGQFVRADPLGDDVTYDEAIEILLDQEDRKGTRLNYSH